MALEVLQRATARSNALADMITTQHLDFAVESGGSPEMMLKLHTLNGFLPFYQQLLRIPRLHPLEVYCELCRLAGQLAIFGESRRPPALPPYDHGSPGPCFGKLFEVVDRLLKELYIVKAPSVKFVPWGRFLVAGLDPVWLEGGKSFYIAVDSDLAAKDVAHVMANQISIGSKETIEQLARNVIPGIKRRLEEKTPGSLPERPRRTYFRLDRKGGEQDLTVGTGELAIFNGSRKEMEFSLYVVSGEKGQFELV
jgi:type VI secretion system protein ImpJ